MANFNTEATNAKQLKTNTAALNAFMAEHGMATKIGPKLPKEKMGEAFMAAMEEIHAAGKLDDVPEGIYKFYTGVAIPEGGDRGEKTQQGGDVAENGGHDEADETTAAANTGGQTETADTAPATKPKKPAKPKAPTHPDIFVGVMRQNPGPVALGALVEAHMAARPGTTEENAKFWVQVYVAFLVAMGMATVENGTVTFNEYTVTA